MCGIAGIINFNNQSINEADLQKMLHAIKHRGPDDEGLYIENNIGLGFVRLSILDLSKKGHQPMISEDENDIIIFNGEIYNYLEIKVELEELGYKFKTETDTEVLLASYLEWGENCLHKFNGMWAFAIYNKKEKNIFISRDRFGIKPFYYYFDGTTFVFASEIPAILKVLNHKPTVNNQIIFDYLVYNRTDQTASTFFTGINKLQHGHLIKFNIEIQTPQISCKKWYNLEDNLKSPFETPKEYFEMLKSAIGLHLRSDVPIGVCFSGGLDSSSIVSVLINDFNLSDIHTFSAIYEKGNKGDESEFINEYKILVRNLFTIRPTAEMLEKDLDQFVKAHAEPIPSTSPYAQFKVMQLAKKHVTVTLDGQGADEQLAGYHYFFGLYFKELILNGKFIKFIWEIICYLWVHKSLYGIKTLVYFLLSNKLKRKVSVNERGYLLDSFINKSQGSSIIADSLYSSKTLHVALLNHFEYKLEHLLKWEDRNSMCFSVEARVPFLDFRLVERTLALPSEKLLKNGTTKYILREAMRGTVMNKIRKRQDKVGFETPESEWFRTSSFQKIINDILNSKSFHSRNIIDVNKAKRIYQKHLDKKINASQEIWKWIHLELWFREFIDEKVTN